MDDKQLVFGGEVRFTDEETRNLGDPDWLRATTEYLVREGRTIEATPTEAHRLAYGLATAVASVLSRVDASKDERFMAEIAGFSAHLARLVAVAVLLGGLTPDGRAWEPDIDLFRDFINTLDIDL